MAETKSRIVSGKESGIALRFRKVTFRDKLFDNY